MASSIGTARFKRFLDKYFQLKGGSGGTFLDDIMPVVQVEDPNALEQLLLRAVHLGMDGDTIPAVAAQFGLFQFVNPVASGYLTTVDQVILSSAVAQNISVIVFGFGAGGPTVKGLLTDTRLVGNVVSIATNTISGHTVAAVGGIPGGARLFARVPAGQTLVIPISVVLPPGSGLNFYGGIVNTAIDVVSVRYRERLAEITELTAVGIGA